MNNFEQMKKSKNIHEMANIIALMVNKLSLYEVDKSVLNLLILSHLKEETTYL